MNIIGLKVDNLENKNLISIKSMSDFIDIMLNQNNILSNSNNVNNNDYINPNVNIYKDNSVFLNNCISNSNIEILTCEVSNNNIKINKINCNDKIIYSINFIGNLSINLRINNTVEPINYNFLFSHSFVYKNTKNNLYIYPINLDLCILNNKIHFCITYAFLDDNLENKNLKSQNINNINEIDLDFSNYTYIDINKEFI